MGLTMRMTGGMIVGLTESVTESVTEAVFSSKDGMKKKEVGIAQRPEFEVDNVFQSVKQLAKAHCVTDQASIIIGRKASYVSNVIHIVLQHLLGRKSRLT